MSVPTDVFRTARHVWIADEATDEEHNLMSSWAWKRWPGMPIPKGSGALALWIVSISFQDGYEESR